MMDDQAIIDADVRAFARSEAEAAFNVWEAGGDFMFRRAQARSAIDQYAVDRASGHGAEFAFRMQGAALFTFLEMQGALGAPAIILSAGCFDDGP